MFSVASKTRQGYGSAILLSLRACLHGGEGPQIGDVTCGWSPHLSCKRDQINMRDDMDRQVTPPMRVTSLGGTPLYKPYRYVPYHRVGFLRPFCLKTGIHLAHFGLESGMVFEGTSDQCILKYSSFQFQMSKKERDICGFGMELNNFWFAL